ncbi:MAG TPA: DNA polymerase/3'-5' exonuclease PolX [Syntrophomonadaceae bacterium]|nr:DNA polymerase/3'-5' exonuclease PolX [Syntrophomonadaceae bacterium]
MTNREVAHTLERIADILQIKDENPFKIRAYRRAADAIYHLNEDVKVLHQTGRLGEIPGVGKSVQSGITEMLEKGSLEYYERLLEEVPSGVLDMLALPGIGYKTIKTIYEGLGIDNLNDLGQAAREGKIRVLPGLGAKTEYNIIKGMELLKKGSKRATLGLALPVGEDFLNYLRHSGVVQEAELVGSIRRGQALVGDIDVLVSTRDVGALLEKVRGYPGLKQIEANTEENIKGRLRWDLPFELIMVAEQAFAAALVWTTGSKSFREILFPEGRRQEYLGLKSETQVFEKLGLPFIPPELRENRGELEAARCGQLPQLIQEGDIQGDLHVHTRWSDGAVDLPGMAEAARNLGYSYLAITDHSQSLAISGGLSPERLHAQGQVIDALNARQPDFHILKGVEADVLKDGRLDYDAEVLKGMDMVIASLHSHFKLDREAQTERILTAIKTPGVNIIGHLTGRLLNRRPAYELDLERVLDAAAKHQMVLEINSHPDRLDVDAEIARQAKERGIKMAVNSDAHDQQELKLLRYGVINARRGWLEKKDVINCGNLDEMQAWLKKK